MYLENIFREILLLPNFQTTDYLKIKKKTVTRSNNNIIALKDCAWRFLSKSKFNRN